MKLSSSFSLIKTEHAFCFILFQANIDTLQKNVNEIRDKIALKKGENKTEESTAANSAPNLSPSGGATAAKDGLGKNFPYLHSV